MNIYVASSWRNKKQPEVVCALKDAGYSVYDFRNPKDNDNKFHWREIDPEWKTWTPTEYIENLKHLLAVKGFRSDWNAMEWADVCILVMPCGRSAHLEAGYFVGAKKKLIILIDNGEPELMYKMAWTICISIKEVLSAI